MNARPPLYWINGELERGSSQNWVPSEGHKPLAEARQLALDALAAAEASLALKQEALMEASAEFQAAQHARDAAYNARQTARHKVKLMQERVAYVCSTDAPPDVRI